MYVTPNFKTKKAFKKAVKSGQEVQVFSPGLFPAPTDGRCSIEDPRFPEPHRWYASVDIEDGYIIKVR